MYGAPIPPELRDEVIEKGAARGVVIERSKTHPNVYFEQSPEPQKYPEPPAPAPEPVFAAEEDSEQQAVGLAEAAERTARADYDQALAQSGGYANDQHLVQLRASLNVKTDLLALAQGKQAAGRQRRAQLIADGKPEAFRAAVAAQTYELWAKAMQPWVNKAEKLGRELAAIRAGVQSANSAFAPLRQRAEQLATEIGIRNFRPDRGDIADAVRLIATAISNGFKKGGAVSQELRHWLGS